MKISNQVMGDGRQMVCRSCNESAKLPMPVKMEVMNKMLKAFISLHEAKGCNLKKIE